MIGLETLRRYAVARSLFKPTTLARAIGKLGFVQADPIRAPARAQDLILRHRVKNYHAGDLERRYASLGIEEDFFVNYGFLPRAHQALLHPRTPRSLWTPATKKRAQAVLEFVQSRGTVHPREVDAHFAHGSVTNYWGGSSSASTHLLENMHYYGLLRVVRRDNGIRQYAAHQHAPGPASADQRRHNIDALVHVIVRKYAPLPAASLSALVRSRLGAGLPQCRGEQLKQAVSRARARLAHARIDGIDWYWPAEENPSSRKYQAYEELRLLAPFDPIVWDRRRFELFWDWAYRFEAYTKAPKRKLGYYALPMLWHDRVIGWGNISVNQGKLVSQLGYVTGQQPGDAAFKRALDEELERIRAFLSLELEAP